MVGAVGAGRGRRGKTTQELRRARAPPSRGREIRRRGRELGRAAGASSAGRELRRAAGVRSAGAGTSSAGRDLRRTQAPPNRGREEGEGEGGGPDAGASSAGLGEEEGEGGGPDPGAAPAPHVVAVAMPAWEREDQRYFAFAVGNGGIWVSHSFTVRHLNSRMSLWYGSFSLEIA